MESHLDPGGLGADPPDLTWEGWNAGVQLRKQERKECEKKRVQYQDAPSSYAKLVCLENYLSSISS